MPELPDLQVFSYNLNKKITGKTLQKITVHRAQKVSEKELKEALEGIKLEEVYREGKELRLRFENGHLLGLHLRLHGKLFLYQEKNTEKKAIVDLLFSDKTGLTLTDYQGIATVALDSEEKTSPDALDDELNAEYLTNKLSKTRTIIKSILLDQNIIRGIGNAYADEILWDARISPLSKANRIPKERVKELVDSIKSVLKEAEKEILKSHPNLINGEIRDFLNIHNSEKTESPTGAIIEFATVASKKTYYTSEQQLFD
ncbi:MAG: DNA-formamidopyrimidine glycosylase [Sphingobacteriales bacterium]|nr:DNA-formamidopyrimidine glycosylase [Sphingobacteriales bacterium]